jgi:ribosome biogenesis GTPase A
VDLVPKEVVAQWLVVLRRHFPTIAFKSSTQVKRRFKRMTMTVGWYTRLDLACLGSAHEVAV